MRRADKEIRDPAAVEAVLDEALVLHLGLVDRGEPYVVPMLFARQGARLYLHSAREGRKMDLLAAAGKAPRICFEVETGLRLQPEREPCSWSFRYRSVIGWGTLSLVTEQEERARGLDLLVGKCRRALGQDPAGGPAAGSYPEAALRATAVLRIDIERMTGKAGGRPAGDPD